MRICYLNPPWEDKRRWGIRAGCRFPNLTAKNTNAYVPFPFLLAYAASYAQKNGAEVLCIDGIAERCSVASVVNRVKEFSPDLIVTETSTTSLSYDLEVLTRLRDAIPQVRIAVYGSHVDVRPQDALEYPAVDCVIRGEPEVASLNLAQAITSGQEMSGVAGVVCRSGSQQSRSSLNIVDQCQSNVPRAAIEDLDELPYPYRTGLPMHRYSVPGFPSPVMFIYGSRGCPYKCNFCLWPQTMLKDNYRARGGAKIADEMAWAMKEYPDIKSFFFDDDTFNLGRERVLDFADRMKQLNLIVPWGMNARADNWDKELMLRLIDTGLFTLRIGIESGDQEVLDKTEKGIRLEQVRETLELSHELGLKNHVSFVIGLIGETDESVNNTIRFIKTLPVDSVQFSVAIPFPGTSFYDHVVKEGHLITQDWKKFNGFEDIVVRTKEMTAVDIKRALIRARRSVYFSPKFILRRLGYIRSVGDFTALSRKAARLLSRQVQ